LLQVSKQFQSSTRIALGNIGDPDLVIDLLIQILRLENNLGLIAG
jgi:hypothetical protein